jgi:hypothetical protein
MIRGAMATNIMLQICRHGLQIRLLKIMKANGLWFAYLSFSETGSWGGNRMATAGIGMGRAACTLWSSCCILSYGSLACRDCVEVTENRPKVILSQAASKVEFRVVIYILALHLLRGFQIRLNLQPAGNKPG